MILTCPECSTRYQTDASLFTPEGRKVRCAKCGHVWFQAAPEAEPELAPPPDVPEEEPAEEESFVPQRAAYAAPAVDYGAASRSQHRRGPLELLGLLFGWGALAGLVGAIAWAAVFYRQDIATLWPQSSTLYKAVGLTVNTRGIDIVYKAPHFETQNGQNVLVITGKLVNITSHELSVPQLRASLTDADKRELYHWNFSANVATLNPGQSAAFNTRLPSPPPAMKRIDLSFAERAN